MPEIVKTTNRRTAANINNPLLYFYAEYVFTDEKQTRLSFSAPELLIFSIN